MPRLTRIPLLLALLTATALALLVSGCGGKLSEDAVAEVDGTEISRSSFDHWMKVSLIQSGIKDPQAFDPPAFSACVKQLREQQTPPQGKQPKGYKPPTDQALRQQCQKQYEGMREQVMQFLITSEWISSEAQARNIKLDDKEVRATYNKQKQQSFPRPKQFEDFLKQSGLTEKDLLFRTRVDLLSNKLREAVTKQAAASAVSPQEIEARYQRDKKQFFLPESYDVNVIVTKQRSQAQQALAALRAGQSFKRVSDRFTSDDFLQKQGGRIKQANSQQFPSPLDQQIAKARPGQLLGPIKTEAGFYVARLNKKNPGRQQELTQVTDQLRSVIRNERTQKELNSFLEELRQRYRKQTVCAKAYLSELCSNGPKPKPTPDAGSQPQGAPPAEQSAPAPSQP